MTYRNLKYVNDLNGIQAERTSDSVAEYFSPGSDKHRSAVNGAYGEISPYVPPEPEPITAQQVKDEAYRRIIAICPEWRQRNLTAQASILAEKGRANWTTEELAAWEAGEAIWSEIATIRAKSNELELMDPIPQDYTEDKWWT